MKKLILGTIDDMIADFLYYDRKEDDQLPQGAIERAIESGEITEQDIVDAFARSLRQGLAR
jgi:hypothetical protein